jgi:Tfp pilus assembly protein PilX
MSGAGSDDAAAAGAGRAGGVSAQAGIVALTSAARITQNSVTRSGCIASLKRAARTKLANACRHAQDKRPLDEGVAYVAVTVSDGLIVELKGCADRAAALAYARPA